MLLEPAFSSALPRLPWASAGAAASSSIASSLLCAIGSRLPKKRVQASGTTRKKIACGLCRSQEDRAARDRRIDPAPDTPVLAPARRKLGADGRRGPDPAGGDRAPPRPPDP